MWEHITTTAPGVLSRITPPSTKPLKLYIVCQVMSHCLAFNYLKWFRVIVLSIAQLQNKKMHCTPQTFENRHQISTLAFMSVK
jgi:hypothetical protein